MTGIRWSGPGIPPWLSRSRTNWRVALEMELLTGLLLLMPVVLTRRREQESPIWARRTLIVLLTVLTVRYLHWRCTASLTMTTGIGSALSLTLLMAEGWLLISGLLPMWLAWRRIPDRRPQAYEAMGAIQTGQWRPQVAILVGPAENRSRCWSGASRGAVIRPTSMRCGCWTTAAGRRWRTCSTPGLYLPASARPQPCQSGKSQ